MSSLTSSWSKFTTVLFLPNLNKINQCQIATVPLFFYFRAIEVITSQTKVISVPDPMYPDIPKPTKVAVWNPTFANLTLMALGSSAPEILLNCIETVSTHTQAS